MQDGHPHLLTKIWSTQCRTSSQGMTSAWSMVLYTVTKCVTHCLNCSGAAGRIPAGFNGCVGLKATVGRVSTTGVVPACASLDCLTCLATTVRDATTVMQIMQVCSYSCACKYLQTACKGSVHACMPASLVVAQRPNGLCMPMVLLSGMISQLRTVLETVPVLHKAMQHV